MKYSRLYNLENKNPEEMTLFNNIQLNKPMPGTYSQIYIHVVFAVRGRQNLISKFWREELYKYISGIVSNKKQKPIIIGGAADHIHALIGIRPSILIADLVRDIKNNSSRFINERNFINGHFSWQEGYGVFSYSNADINNVYNYILNQDKHHERKKFRDEFCQLLNDNDVEQNEKYLFDWYDDHDTGDV